MEIVLHFENAISSEKVWGGKISKKLSNDNCVSRSEAESESFAGIIIESLIIGVVEATFDGVFGTYPEPPSVSEVATKIFFGFYENMP